MFVVSLVVDMILLTLRWQPLCSVSIEHAIFNWTFSYLLLMAIWWRSVVWVTYLEPENIHFFTSSALSWMTDPHHSHGNNSCFTKHPMFFGYHLVYLYPNPKFGEHLWYVSNGIYHLGNFWNKSLASMFRPFWGSDSFTFHYLLGFSRSRRDFGRWKLFFLQKAACVTAGGNPAHSIRIIFGALQNSKSPSHCHSSPNPNQSSGS